MEKIKSSGHLINRVGVVVIILDFVLFGLIFIKVGSLDKPNELRQISFRQENVYKSQDFKIQMSLSGGSVSTIVASKNGTKYYLPGCSGIDRIKPENRVFFDTEEQALDAGYEISKNCKK